MALRTWLALSALFLGLAVAAGAFGAHSLRDKIDPYSLSIYDKAVFYQFVHALGMLIVVGLGLVKIFSPAEVQPIAALFSVGIVFFSGSLYALAITGIRQLGAVTPIGGVLFLIAWALLAWRSWNLPAEQ